MLLIASNVGDTLLNWATTVSIYEKFDTTLLEINLKFEQWCVWIVAWMCWWIVSLILFDITLKHSFKFNLPFKYIISLKWFYILYIMSKIQYRFHSAFLTGEYKLWWHKCTAKSNRKNCHTCRISFVKFFAWLLCMETLQI